MRRQVSASAVLTEVGMIKDAVINGKTVELCDTDAKAAEIFHSGFWSYPF